MSDVDVYLATRDWKMSIQNNLTTAQRVYLDASANTGEETETLPVIGQKFSDDYPYLTCKKIDIEYLSDRKDCPRSYTCYYDSNVVQIWYGDAVPIPCNASISASYDTYTNPPSAKDGAWYWEKAPSEWAADVRIPQMIYTETITLTTWIYGTDLKEYHEDAYYKCLNHVNKAVFLGESGTTPLSGFPPPSSGGFQPGTVLYLGSDLQEVIQRGHQRKWQNTMHFQVRCVPFERSGTSEDDWGSPFKTGCLGWNGVFNKETGKYDKLCLGVPAVAPAVNKYLYKEADFDVLFTVSAASTGTVPDLPEF